MWRGACLVCRTSLAPIKVRPVGSVKLAGTPLPQARLNRKARMVLANADTPVEVLQPGQRYARQGDINGVLPLAPEPTTARPGSLKKMQVMAWRLANGYHLHHPLDLRFADDHPDLTRFMIPCEAVA